MSNRLYIGDKDRDNGIWDWTLGTQDGPQEFVPVVGEICQLASCTVYIDSGGARVAMDLYRYIVTEAEWLLDHRTYFKASTMSEPDPEVESCVKEIDRLEEIRRAS